MASARLFLSTTVLCCTSASAGLPTAGDAIGLFYCGSNAGSQSFDLGSGALANHIVASGTESGNTIVWDISGPSNSSGAPLHMWGSYSPIHPSQTWAYDAPSSSIKSLYNGKCVSATDELVVSSALVIENCDAASPLQRFTYNAANKTFLAASAPGLCVQAANLTLSCLQPPLSLLPFCNATLPIATRVADVVSRMTPAEKAASLDSGVPAIGRLGLPAMPSGEALHGVAVGCFSPSSNNTGCASSFPCPMALGAAFDSTLWEAVGTAIGYESRAFANAGRGNNWLFAPNINLARDPRWGRNQEVPGEDPVAVGQYAASFIRGLQGADGVDKTHLLAASTAKHFLVYDFEGYEPRTDDMPRPASAVCDTPGGCQRWNMDAYPPQRDFDGYYLPPFERAIKDAGVRSVMCSYVSCFYLFNRAGVWSVSAAVQLISE